MQIKMFSVTDELNCKLKKETNASALIRDLLSKHYNLQEQNKLTAVEKLRILQAKKKEEESERLLMAEDLIHQAELIKQIVTPIIENVLTEEDVLLKEIELENEKEKEIELEKEKRIKKEQYKKDNIFKTFKEEVGREMTEEEYQEYQEQINEKNFNLFKFCEQKRT